MMIHERRTVSNDSDLMKQARASLGMTEKDYDPPFPLPNMKEVEWKDFWHQISIWGTPTEIYSPPRKIDDRWYKVMIYYVNHSQLIGGGFVVLYRYEYKREAIRYFTWIDCLHEWTSRNIGRCLNRYTCLQCGRSYEVDSSD